MQFSLSKSGTTDEVRQALYDAERNTGAELPEEVLAVRAFGHAIAVQIDAKEIDYNRRMNALRGSTDEETRKAAANEPKPTITVSASFAVTIS